MASVSGLVICCSISRQFPSRVFEFFSVSRIVDIILGICRLPLWKTPSQWGQLLRSIIPGRDGETIFRAFFKWGNNVAARMENSHEEKRQGTHMDNASLHACDCSLGYRIDPD